jgi:hypothetical protein
MVTNPWRWAQALPQNRSRANAMNRLLALNLVSFIELKYLVCRFVASAGILQILLKSNKFFANKQNTKSKFPFTAFYFRTIRDQQNCYYLLR